MRKTRIDTWGLCGDKLGFLFSARHAEDRRHGAASENRKQSLTPRSAIPSVGVNGRGRFTMGDLRRYKLQVEIQNVRWDDNQASTALAGSAQGTRRYPVSAQ